MDNKDALVYAQLSQQCYQIPNSNEVMPEGCEILYVSKDDGNWDTSYALYINQNKKELILGIRGTEPTKLFNMLTNAGLVASALKGNYQRPPHQDRVENIAQFINLNLNISIEELQDIDNKIKAFDNNVGNSIKAWIIALLWITAMGAGLMVASLSSVFSLVGTPIIVLSTVALMNMNLKNFKILKASLGGQPQSAAILNLADTILGFKNRHFKSYALKIVGHSLGAVMAELCAVKVGVQCISFESPGSAELLNSLSEYKDRPQNIINYMSAPNLINTLNKHSGRIYRLKLPHTDGSFSKIHLGKCLLASAFNGLAFGGFALGGVAALGVAATRNAAIAAAGCALGSKFIGIFPDIWSDIEWLKRQHSIDNIVLYLQQNNPVMVEMFSWPKVVWERKSQFFTGVAKSFVPLQKDKPGIRNILDEEGMREEQVQKMNGYIKRYYIMF